MVFNARACRQRSVPGRKLFGQALAIIVITAPLCGPTFGESQKAAAVPSALVDEVLRGEVAGSIANREQALASILEQSPDDAAARWQAGYTRWHDQWRKFDDRITDPSRTETMASYRAARDQAEDTAADQLKLAEWCRRRKLAEQERTHLSRVLLLDPNHAEARNRLGWRRVGNRWFQERELAQVRERTQMYKEAFRKYGATVQRALANIAGNDPRARREAETRLQALSDPAMVPVLEKYLPAASEDAQVQGVAVLAQISSPSAALSLARMAVADPLSPLGTAATKALRDKPESHYIPALLSLLSSPVASRYAVFQTNRGALIYQHLFERELEDRREAMLVTRNVQGRTGAALLPFAPQLAGEALDEEGRVADANLTIQELNQRVCSVLRTVTGEELPSQPDAWWNWWYDRNEVYLAGEKPTYRVARTSTLSVPSVTVPNVNRYECLVKGTPVTTFEGPVAIEQVKVGDLVLSQNVRTGELAYQPVLATTVRPPNSVVRIETSSDTWRASGGHLFWVVGRGWTRARQLEAGHRLRTVSGTTVVQTADAEAEPVLTYNLIVGDFHSYFVGQDKVLSHDNTIPESTSALVPGWKSSSRQ